ncbi:MAG: aminopeptidase P family protein [Armatimonadetes bacterium]|nr:aminopeptidase P family protein [Armatimonadota bacterium]
MERTVTRRMEKIRQRLESSELEGLIVVGAENRRYLSGFTGSNGWLLITGELQLLVTDGRYWSQVEDQSPDWQIVRFKAQDHGRLSRILAQRFQELGGSGRLGFEMDHISFAQHEQMEEDFAGIGLVPTSDLVEALRQVKDADELERMRRAAAVADRAFLKMLEHFREGVRESELCAELEYLLQKEGARKPAFDTIVASGPNGAYPHAGVTDRRIGRGELTTLDFGALVDGYASDITRTVWLGELPEPALTVHRVVRDAQRAALDAVRPGISAAELDGVARKIIEDAGYGEAFSHSLGHGIGLAVHEPPTLRSTTETVLEPGMVITIEPGIYLPGETGCRIEDTVLVTDSGFDSITRAPKQEPGQPHPLD